MKKIITVLILAIMPFVALAQSHGGGERIKAMKVAYFTEKIGLTANESEKFWPLYNEYWKERRNVAHKMRDVFARVEKGVANNNELEVFFEARDSENAIIRRWSSEFKKAIAAEKVIRVFMAEETFKHFLLKQRPPQPAAAAAK